MRSIALNQHILKSTSHSARRPAAAAVSTSSQQLPGRVDRSRDDSDFDALRRRRKTEWKRKQGVSYNTLTGPVYLVSAVGSNLS